MQKGEFKVDRKEISDKVKKLFLDLIQKEESKLPKSYCTDNFFGSKIQLLPGDVVAYLYSVENEFGLKVPSTYILEGKFNTLENVTDIICDILQKQAS